MKFCKHAVVAACLLFAMASCSSDEEAPGGVASPQGGGSPQAQASVQGADSESPTDPVPDDTPAAPTSSVGQAFRSEPENQRVSRGATGLTVHIFAEDLPAGVALVHLALRYDSELLVATGVTCGAALPGHVALPNLFTAGIADVGCGVLPIGVSYEAGNIEIATVTFDALQAAGESDLELLIVEVLDVDRACLLGWSGNDFCPKPGDPVRIGSITVE